MPWGRRMADQDGGGNARLDERAGGRRMSAGVGAPAKRARSATRHLSVAFGWPVWGSTHWKVTEQARVKFDDGPSRCQSWKFQVSPA